MRVVRWLQAFRKETTLHASLRYELQNSYFEVAAEPMRQACSGISGPRVGLLVRRSAITRVFSGDVWSKWEPGGKLAPTRKACETTWGECFCRPEFVGIVCKNWNGLTRKDRSTVRYFARKYSLPVFQSGHNWRAIEI